MKKNLQISELNDIYGALLTEHQRDVLRSYYDFDLSLAEIAENDGISRQAVRDALVKAEELLADFESKLGLLEKREHEREAAKAALDEIENGNIEPAKAYLSNVIVETVSGS